jgi:hypothetical protein
MRMMIEHPGRATYLFAGTVGRLCSRELWARPVQRVTTHLFAGIVGWLCSRELWARPVQHFPRTACFAALLAIAAPNAPLAAQHAVPLDAQHPRAVRAGAIVERLIAGDRAGAEAYLRANGDSAYVASPRMREELDRMKPLAEGEFRIQAFVRPGPEIIEIVGADAVFVMLASPTINGEAVQVRVSAEVPYRILGVAPARTNRH